MRRLLVLPCLLSLCLSVPYAQGTPAPDSTTVSAAALKDFLDPFFVEQMEALHIPGVVFVMVRDSAIVYSKGYGYADVEAHTLVDPEETLFQVASVSKLFTATAVMQLVEQGQVELYSDVNDYLHDFHLEETFDKPVTLAHLLTHTGGFDERNLGYIARDTEAVPSLGAYLSERMPPRTFPPGTVTSYSNHGFGLAGHIVEAISGEPFPRYLDQHLFHPLGMQQSTFETPLPPHQAPRLARGYRWNGETYDQAPLFIRKVPPARYPPQVHSRPRRATWHAS